MTTALAVYEAEVFIPTNQLAVHEQPTTERVIRPLAKVA